MQVDFNYMKSTRQQKDKTYFERGIELIIMNGFENFSRFTVFAEIRKYKAYEDEALLKQQREELPQIVEIYFDNEFLCDVVDTMSPGQIYQIIQNNLYYKIFNKQKKN